MLSATDAAKVSAVCEATKDMLLSRAKHLVAHSHGLPLLSSQSCDGTPLRCMHYGSRSLPGAKKQKYHGKRGWRFWYPTNSSDTMTQPMVGGLCASCRNQSLSPSARKCQISSLPLVALGTPCGHLVPLASSSSTTAGTGLAFPPSSGSVVVGTCRSPSPMQFATLPALVSIWSSCFAPRVHCMIPRTPSGGPTWTSVRIDLSCATSTYPWSP